MSKNEKLVLDATEYARLFLNIDDGLWILINDIDHFESINHIALYDKDNFLIRYNKEWLKTAKNENIIKTAFHEIFHVLQHACIVESKLGIHHNIFTKEKLIQMEKEFMDENYSTKVGVYENLLIEQQAEAFAIALYEKYIKEKGVLSV